MNSTLYNITLALKMEREHLMADVKQIDSALAAIGDKKTDDVRIIAGPVGSSKRRVRRARKAAKSPHVAKTVKSPYKSEAKPTKKVAPHKAPGAGRTEKIRQFLATHVERPWSTSQIANGIRDTKTKAVSGALYQLKSAKKVNHSAEGWSWR